MNQQESSNVDYEFLVPGKPDSLAAVRWIITRLGYRMGLNEDSIGMIEIAVDEVCSNIMEHAYRSSNPKPPIHIEITADKERFVVDVIDQGPAFHYDGDNLPHFPEHYMEGHERGAGLYIISKCMDEIEYTRLPDERNRVRLVKKLTVA